MKHAAIILLAAGSSSRFGQPKQLVPFNGTSLIQHALSEAAKVVKNMVVVLGANAAMIQKEIDNNAIQVVYNEHWKEGMSSSIRCGLAFLLKQHPLPDAIICMVCDQPFVTSSLLKEITGLYEASGKPIVASAYNNTCGTPVLFDKIFFPELSALTGQFGAKKIISQHLDSTITIPFPLGHIDIDTKEDYAALQNLNTIPD